MVRVLYIGCCARSGSTITDRMIGQMPGFVSTGELGLLTTHSMAEDRLCGCGTRFSECAFWMAVGERALGGWDSPEAGELRALHPRVTRQRHLPMLLLPGVRPRFARDLERYRALLGRLYAALHVVSGAEVIVDSTKAPAYACALRGIPGIDLRIVHLVRDIRGAAYSSTKRQIVRDAVDRVVWKHRYPPLVFTLRWIVYHLIFDGLRLLDGRQMVVRYEDVIASPRETMTRIADFAGRPADEGALAFATPPSVHLGIAHTTVGNDMRFQHGDIVLREDDEWRRSLGRWSRRAVTVMSWPLLRRWGYA